MRQDFVFKFLDKRIGTEFNFEKINGGTGFDLRNGNTTVVSLNFLMVTSKTTNKKILTLASPSDTFWFDTNILEDWLSLSESESNHFLTEWMKTKLNIDEITDIKKYFND
jgi:hypothetical protein